MGHRILHCFFSVFANIDRLCGLSQNESCFFAKNLDFFSELPIFSVCPSVSSYICDHADMRETQETAALELKSAGQRKSHVICHLALRTIANHRKRPPR